MEVTPKERRKRGRPMGQWMEEVVEAMSKRGLQEGDQLDREGD